MTVHDHLAAAHAWIEGDPDPETRGELQRLIDRGELDELRERMAGSLEFGTAGLRGKVEAGSNRMNRAVVIRATRGVCDFLLQREPSKGPVVVGFDARPSSRQFMRDAVGVLAAAGIPVRLFPEPIPTPIVAYEALRSEARAAIVITASHNPPADNGYKVYASNGAQIVPPTDRQIADAIDAVGAAADVPRIEDIEGHELVTLAPDDVFARYRDDLEPHRSRPPAVPTLTIAYTPLHGVGGRYAVELLAAAGYRDVHPAADQFDPDGSFPTVEFPNPEEPGALDMVTDVAARVGADLVLANDPDADRLAVALPESGGWRALSGNQIGVLLADFLLERTSLDSPIVISSIVSSPMLAAIADSHGARFEQSLTGFKWIWNAALDLEAAGEGTFLFGYEEALGYSVSPAVRDKDGLSAALVFTDLAAACTAGGTTVADRLAGLYRRHGLWADTQVSVVRPGMEGEAEIDGAMSVLTQDPPTEIDGQSVTATTDFNRGAADRPRYLPATNLVLLELGDAGRLLVRPSGTEPKLKIYGYLRAGVSTSDDLHALEASLQQRVDRLADTLVAYLGFA